jgi:hypothetical protein
MATYTLVITGDGDGHQHVTLVDFSQDQFAIGAATCSRPSKRQHKSSMMIVQVSATVQPHN